MRLSSFAITIVRLIPGGLHNRRLNHSGLAPNWRTVGFPVPLASWRTRMRNTHEERLPRPLGGLAMPRGGGPLVNQESDARFDFFAEICIIGRL